MFGRRTLPPDDQVVTPDVPVQPPCVEDLETASVEKRSHLDHRHVVRAGAGRQEIGDTVRERSPARSRIEVLDDQKGAGRGLVEQLPQEGDLSVGWHVVQRVDDRDVFAVGEASGPDNRMK